MQLSDLSPGHLFHDVTSFVKQTGKELVKGAVAAEILPDRLDLTPKLPAYDTLAHHEGPRPLSPTRMSVPQAAIRDGKGRRHEPINLVVAGTRKQLTKALEAAGWKSAQHLGLVSEIKTAFSLFDRLTPLHHLFRYNDSSSPVSTMYLDGKPAAMVFDKNDTFDMARDHLRIFATGKKDAQGRPLWAIAATRDVGMHLDLGKLSGYHAIDPAIDKERDQVMADLLDAGQVQSWRSARGPQSKVDRAEIARNYQTDGNAYLVSLKPAPARRH